MLGRRFGQRGAAPERKRWSAGTPYRDLPVTRAPVLRTQPRTGRLIACLLAFSAGLLVLTSGLAWVYLENPPSAAGAISREVPASASDSVALAEWFYEAVNGAIETGDISTVIDLVDPTFAEYPARTGLPAGRDGLVQSLLAIHASSPALRIVLDSAVASAAGDEVTVRLRTTGAETGAFLGIPLPDEMRPWGWGPLEVVRIADGKIAERWSGQEPAAVLQPLSESGPLPGGEETALDVIALLRVTIAPDATVRFTTGLQARFLMVETGTLSMTLHDVADGAPLPYSRGAWSEHRLDAGATALTPPRSEVAIANAAGPQASLLMAIRYAQGYSLAPPDGSADPAQAQATAVASSDPTRVSSSVLTTGIIPPGSDVRFRLGRVTMPAGSTLTWPPGPAVLIAADAGELALATDEVGTEGIRADGERWFDDDTTLETGDGASIPAETGSTWRNSSNNSSMLLVLTLTVS